MYDHRWKVFRALSSSSRITARVISTRERLPLPVVIRELVVLNEAGFLDIEAPEGVLGNKYISLADVEGAFV